MFSLYDYPIQGKDGLPLCEKHGKKLEMLEVVIIDREATELSPPDPCRKPSGYLREKSLRSSPAFYTVVLDCPGKDSFRLWPLPVIDPWFEDWWEREDDYDWEMMDILVFC